MIINPQFLKTDRKIFVIISKLAQIFPKLFFNFFPPIRVKSIYNWNPVNFQLMAKIDLFFLWIKPKKLIKSKEYTDFGQAGKISIQLDDEYYENGGNTKIQKFMMIFAKICTEKRKLSYIFRIWAFSHFCNIYLQVGR